MLRQRLENYGVLLSFCILVFFSFYQLSLRVFLFADELISTARTYRSAGNFAENYFDYSLRPLYRVFNQLAVSLFGTAVNSLWLASALFLTASTIGIIALARPFLRGATLATIPLLVLVYPYYGSIGLSAMPHATSSVYAAIAILLALPALKAVLDNVETGTETRYAVLSGVFLALTLFAHPGQIAAVAAILLVFGMVGLVPVASRRWKAALVRSIRLLGPGLLAFCACIAAMDIAYRILTAGVPSARLLDGWTYSYVNLWFGNAAFIDSDLTQYTKPFSFYFLILWNSFTAFTVATMAVILIATGVLAVNLRRSAWKRSDLIYFVPAASLLLWLVFTSLISYAANRILSGATMIYPLALAFLLEYLIRQNSVAIRLGWLVTAAVGGIAIYAAIADLGPRNKQFSRYIDVFQRPYLIARSLPQGPVAVVSDGVQDFEKVVRYCGYFANAGGRPTSDMTVGADGAKADELVSTLMNPKISGVCLHSSIAARNNFEQAGLIKLYQGASGLEIWQKPVAEK